MTGYSSFAGVQSHESDTTIVEKNESPFHWRLTARVHSKGMFTYGGRMGSGNPTFDMNVTFEYRKWGLLVYKGLDLQDHMTDYNFSLLTVFRNFKISRNISFTPHLGSILGQSEHFADEGSDAVCILITAVKIKPHLTFEHMGMLGNLVFEPTDMDWVNRFRLTYGGKHLDVIASIWHNNQVFDHTGYVTGGLNVACSRMKIAKEIFLGVGVTGMATLHTSDQEENPSESSLMLTFAAQWVH
jgi:hypothetical protein